jgi:multisubunit Na+/H+ antiporter MnhE subunit
MKRTIKVFGGLYLFWLLIFSLIVLLTGLPTSAMIGTAFHTFCGLMLGLTAHNFLSDDGE